MKRSKESSNNSVENVAMDGDGSDSDEREKIDVEFEAFGLCEDDADGISRLLKQLFLDAPIDSAEMAELLVSQTGLGCIFKTVDEDDVAPEDEDNDVYGVVSVLDFKQHRTKRCVQQLKGFALKKFSAAEESCGEKSREEFRRTLEAAEPQRLGFLVNERVVNLPHHIALPALESLRKEMSESGRKFDFYLSLLKICKFSGDASGSASARSAPSGKKGKKRKRNSSAGVAAGENDSVFYVNAEEEFLVEECLGYFDYAAERVGEKEKWDYGSGDHSANYRRMVLFDDAALERFLSKLSRDVQSTC